MAPVPYRWVASLMLLCILEAIALTPETALATCGDYLRAGSHSGDYSQSEAVARRLNNDLQPTQAPCHGPNCRRNSAPPILPTPAPASQPTNDQFAILAIYSVRDGEEANWSVPELVCPSYASCASGIFHPPR